MGLFDAYQFSPQSYGGGGQGGLLDLIRSFQQAPQPAQQQPANYFQPQQPQPTGQAELPQNATPTAGPPMNILPQQQPQQQPQQPAQGGGFLESIRDNGILGSLLGQGGARNQTAQALIANGLDPQLAAVVVKDPQLMRAILPQLSGIGGRTDDIKEFEYAKRNGFQGSLETWMQRKRSGAGEYGMTPIWGTDKNGKPVVLQLGKSGAAVASQIPEGFSIARDPVKIEGPTGTTLVDPQSRQPVGFIPKDVKGAAKEREIGEAEGKAAVTLPSVITKAEQTLTLIDEMIAHPGRQTATGLSGTLDPRNYLGGTDATNFKVRSKQLEGKAFLEAFESLKGGGAITETEGVKAANAIARLDRSQSDDEYVAALKDLKEIVTTGMKNARIKAGVGAAPTTTEKPSPANDLKKKYGLQ